MLACKNSGLSSLFATFIGHFTGREICTLATEFHTGDVDQHLHKSGSHGPGVPNLNLSDFKLLLGKSSSKTQMLLVKSSKDIVYHKICDILVYE